MGYESTRRAADETFGQPLGSPSGDITGLEEADHRIANHLALLTGYVRLKAANLAKQPQEPNRQSMLLLVNSIGTQIDCVARLHRALASKGSNAFADIGEHLREICRAFLDGLSGEVKIEEDFCSGCVVRVEQILPISQIVTEVVTNALKYAYTGRDRGTIQLRCRTGAGGVVLVEVIDDGSGFPDDFDAKIDGGLGLRLVRALSEAMDATTEFDSTSHGLSFRLTIPPACHPSR